MLAPSGAPLTTQVALVAMLGPLLVHATVPLTRLPALGLTRKPPTTAVISAWGTIAITAGALLFAGVGSAVDALALVPTFKGPAAGAIKVLAQVIAPPTAKGLGTGSGVQLCTAAGGSPVSAQRAFSAALMPLLVQVPDTVTLWPAFTLAGALTVATMSACGTGLVAACAVLLAGFGSPTLLLAVPVIVNGAPLAGAM